LELSTASSAAAGDEGAEKGGGVVLQLLLHDGVERAAALDYRMRSSRVGAWGHGGDVGGFEQEEPGRPGAAARRSDVDDHRRRRIEDLAHHFAGGVEQAAGGVELDEDRVGAEVFGSLEASGEVLVADGLDGVVEAEDDDLRRRG
jgi:hypothetical protein